MEESWNHNSHYYDRVLASIPGPRSSVLDVGCGEGRLLARIAPLVHTAIGIDQDESALEHARTTLRGAENVQVIAGDFLTASELRGKQFDAITCIAALHHIPLRPALERMRDLLAPNGVLHIIGLTANETIADKVIAAAQLFPARIGSAIHREESQPHMTIKEPDESLSEIRQAAQAVLPRARIKRHLYYRYSLTWTKPQP